MTTTIIFTPDESAALAKRAKYLRQWLKETQPDYDSMTYCAVQVKLFWKMEDARDELSALDNLLKSHAS